MTCHAPKTIDNTRRRRSPVKFCGGITRRSNHVFDLRDDCDPFPPRGHTQLHNYHLEYLGWLIVCFGGKNSSETVLVRMHQDYLLRRKQRLSLKLVRLVICGFLAVPDKIKIKVISGRRHN